MTALIRGRRAFLATAGSLLALPTLESLLPRAARAAGTPPRRFAALFFPNGTDSWAEWATSGSGSTYSMGTAHAALQPLKPHFSIIRGLNNVNCSASPGHSRGNTAFLSGAVISEPVVPRAGVSIDQLMAQAIGGATKLPSLQLGPTPYAVPPQDVGWTSAYNTYLSWRSDTQGNPAIESPQQAFDRILGASTQPTQTRETLRQTSILDYAAKQTTRLSSRLSQGDRKKLDEYLTSLRDVERRLKASTVSSTCSGTRPAAGLAFPEHTRAMLDLIVLAFQCDMTRVITYQMDYGFGNKDFAFLLGGNRELHHNITHTSAADDPATREKHRRITQWYVDQYAYLLTRLSAISEGSGTLLDSTIALLGSELGDGRGHNGDDLPIIVGGRGGGALNPGRLIDAGGVPHTRLLLALLNAMGVAQTSFGGTSTALAL